MDWPANADLAPEGIPDDGPVEPTEPEPLPDDSGAQPDTEPEPEGTPEGDRSDPESGSADAQPQGDGQPPPYRFEEVIEQRNTAVRELQNVNRALAEMRAENAAFKRMFAAAAGVESRDPNAPKPLSEREQSLASRIFGLLQRANPNLGKALELAARADALNAAADRVSVFDQRAEAENDRYANASMDRLGEGYARLALGQDGKLEQADQDSWRQFQVDFVSWLKSHPDLEDRYNRGDGAKLVDEFIARQERLYFAPGRRRRVAAVTERVERGRNLPSGGSSAAPVSSGPKKLDLSDEDAVADHSWEVAKAAMGR